MNKIISSGMKFLIAALLVSLLAGCSATPTATPVAPTATVVPPSPTPVPPTPTPAPDAKAIARAAATKLEMISSVHFLVDIKQGEVVIITGISFKRAEGDYAKAEKYQAKLRVLTALGQVDAETIGIVGDQWILVKALSSNWQKLPPDVGFKASILFDPSAGLGAVSQNAKDLKIVGSATIDGVDCWQIAGISTGAEIAPLTANTVKQGDIEIGAWIAKSDSLFRQITLKELGGDPGKAANWQLNFSKYDQPITITKPPGV